MPNPLEAKTILLGVSGSIAAYKAVDLASKLYKMGAIVVPVLTEAAAKFVLPLSFQSVTGQRSYSDVDLWDREGHVVHISLARAADLVVIAPASANTLAKLANGIADNLLTVTTLAASCPILVAPAMDAGMYNNPATQANMETLTSRGYAVVGPATGHLASGLVGVGRMTEPLEIIGKIKWLLSRQGPLTGKKVVVTAGGTREKIDPVRFITNRSSGKQGYAIASAALYAGADVTLITTKTDLPAPFGCSLIETASAAEMLSEVEKACLDADILIMSAAVSDYRPANPSAQKIKKGGSSLSIDLEPTPDILMTIAEQRKKTGFPKYTVGFAAETENLVENARAKMEKKSLDLMIANSVDREDAGFEVDTNKISILFKDGKVDDHPLMPKDEVAETIIRILSSWVSDRKA